MKVLITGSNGQLGRALKKEYRDRPDIDLLLTDICEMDITDLDDIKKVFSSFNPDVVINCAAHTAVDMCEDDSERAYALNRDGAKNIAIASSEINAKMIHISTDYIFDGESDIPYLESDTPNPQSVYGRSKLAGENEVMNNNPKSFIVRTAWLYGEGKNFVKTMLRLSATMDTIKVVNDQFGAPTSAKEVAKAIVVIADSEEYGIYHTTCDGMCCWYEFSKKIFDLRNIDIEIIPCSSEEFPMKAKRPKYSVLSNQKLKDVFDYKLPAWQDAIVDYFDELFK